MKYSKKTLRLAAAALAVAGATAVMAGASGGAPAHAAGGSAYATAATSSTATGVIHGCADRHAIKGGVHELGILEAGKASCPMHTTALDWNQQGPQGPAGAQGPQGPAGTVSGIGSDCNTITINAADNVAIKAGQSVVIEVGASRVEITPAGVNITAPVINLNGCQIITTITCP